MRFFGGMNWYGADTSHGIQTRDLKQKQKVVCWSWYFLHKPGSVCYHRTAPLTAMDPLFAQDTGPSWTQSDPKSSDVPDSTGIVTPIKFTHMAKSGKTGKKLELALGATLPSLLLGCLFLPRRPLTQRDLSCRNPLDWSQPGQPVPFDSSQRPHPHFVPRHYQVPLAPYYSEEVRSCVIWKETTDREAKLKLQAVAIRKLVLRAC